VSNYAKLLFIAPLLLSACAQSEPANGATEAALADASAEVTLESSLARPQPQKPICSVCGVDGPGPFPPPPPPSANQELSMIINSEYVGAIEDLQFVVYTDTDKITYSFDSSVIDDLNDPTTNETIVMMNIPEIERGLLVFETATATFNEPVYVN
jgi:hypothetical protein